MPRPPDIQLPHWASFAMAFLLGGPALIGPAMMLLNLTWEPAFLLSGFVWWIGVAFAPQTAPLSIIAPVLAGLALWVLMQVVLTRFNALRVQRWRFVVLSCIAAGALSLLVATPGALWFERVLTSSPTHSMWQSVVAFVFGPGGALVALVGAMLGAMLGLATKQLRSNSTLERDAPEAARPSP